MAFTNFNSNFRYSNVYKLLAYILCSTVYRPLWWLATTKAIPLASYFVHSPLYFRLKMRATVKMGHQHTQTQQTIYIYTYMYMYEIQQFTIQNAVAIDFVWFDGFGIRWSFLLMSHFKASFTLQVGQQNRPQIFLLFFSLFSIRFVCVPCAILLIVQSPSLIESFSSMTFTS